MVVKMPRFIKKQDARKGQIPGSAVFIGTKHLESAQIHVIDYNSESITENTPESASETKQYLSSDSVTWINIDGLHDTDLIGEIGSIYNIHPLAIEDILNTSQRPKVEDYDGIVFISIKMMRIDEKTDNVISEQLSLLLGSNFVITFQEKTGDVFDPVRERIRKCKGRVRNSGADYLAYALLDTIVDNYLLLLGNIGEKIESNEDEIANLTQDGIINKIMKFKADINYLRKHIRPAKDAILKLSRLDSDLLSDALTPFLRDLFDLILQVEEGVETYREILSDQLNIYNSNLSNRMNEVMKVLTVFAAIFIPLTFVAGIYGTNFDNLPELHYRYSYFIFWGVLIIIAAGMLYYFRKKKWI